jgi:AraC-like DNA-binding protein
VAELVFEWEGSDPQGQRRGFQSARSKEYYKGEYQIVPTAQASVRIEKGLASTYSVINLRSSSPMKYRRNWHHIRQDKIDVSVLWFVKRGSILFSNSNGSSVIKSGQCMISRSLQPFRLDCFTDEDSHHELLHMVAPTHLIRAYIPDHVQAGTTFSTQHGDCRLALRTCELLYEEGSFISARAADGLAREAVSAIGSVLTSAPTVPTSSLRDKRFGDFVAFIQRHLGNSELSAAMVAQEYGISNRYLSYILKAHGTSFSELVWISRLERAQAWLVAENMRHLSISQISYMAGFKNPAHFSRMFKGATKLSPRDFREQKSEA